MSFAAPQLDTAFEAPETDIFKAPDEDVDSPSVKLDPYQESYLQTGLTDPSRQGESDFTVALAKGLPQDFNRGVGYLGNVARAIPSDIAQTISGDEKYYELKNLSSAALGDTELPIDEPIREASSESPAASTMAKVSQGLAGSAPLLATASLPALAGRLVAAGFSADMISKAPQLATELGAELGKPEEQRDKDKLTSLVSEAIQIGAFAPLAGAHAGKGFKAPKTDLSSESNHQLAKSDANIKEVFPETTTPSGKTVQTPLKNIGNEVGNVLDQLNLGENKIASPELATGKPTIEGESERPQQPTETIETKSESGVNENSASDYDQYHELTKKMSNIGLDNSNTPEFQAAWKEREQVKNRNGGMPPKEPSAVESKETPPSTGIENQPVSAEINLPKTEPVPKVEPELQSGALEARLAHNQKVVGSIPTSATKSSEAVLDSSDNVKLKLPTGATMLRVTTNYKGRNIEKVISKKELESGNVFKDSGVTKVEAGTIGQGNKFTPVKGDVSISDASIKAAKKIEDFIPSKTAMGITPLQRENAGFSAKPSEIPKSNDPKVETRWQNARRSEVSLFQKAKDAAIAIKNEFTRADPKLNPKTDGVFIDIARRFRTIPRHSQEVTANILRGFTAGFDRNNLEVYQRNIILKDLAKDVDAGLYSEREIPFGYTPETLKSDVSKFEKLAEETPPVKEAIERRNEFMDTLKKEMVEADLLPEKVLDDKDYFHRQVVEYLNLKDAFTSGTSSGDVRTHTKGFQRARTHSSKDYNTSYLESEYEVIAQSLAQLRTKKIIAEFKKHGDIKPQLMEQAKESGASWESLVPKDYTIWQPKEGHAFFRAMTLPDKVVDEMLTKGRILTKDEIKEVLALGQPREQWVIPKRLAETLDNINPMPETGMVSKAASKINTTWKVWILMNPESSIKYGLNNLSGDADIAFAYSPKILSHYAPKAAVDMRRYILKRGAITKEISEGIENGVLSGGFSVAEVPDINSHQFFRVMTGENVNLIERAWQKNKDYHNWRESVLRLAAWRFFKDKLDNSSGGKRFYAASRKSEVDALYDAGKSTDEIAAKLSRELIGDYGNISHAGQWIRSHAMPFYSWMEINAPRYVRLLKNSSSEGEGNTTKRIAGVAAKKTAGLALKPFTAPIKTTVLAAGLYTLVNLWNHSFFPNEEQELGDQRRQLHLILGRNEDGTIRTLRIQGALSDALSWIGMEDLPSDISDVVSGKESISSKGVDALKAPPTKLISGANPFIKTPAEALTQRSLFPDPFNPRPIRDPAEQIAKMFKLEIPYRYLTDKPMRPLMNEIAGLVTYSTDAGEASYHMARGMVAAWKVKQGDESPSIIPTKRQNALFYYKMALKYGENEKAERWKQRYMNLGGKQEGIKQSIKMSNPLGGLSSKKKHEFEATLSPKEMEIIQRAEDWYEKTYNP